LQVKVALQNIYVLSAVEGEKATIEFRTVVLTPGVEPFISAQLVQREKSGKAVFDLKQGLLLSREVHVDGTVNGFHGARSSVRAKRTYRERLLTDEASASRDAQSGIETGVSVSKQ
jgi:hypothetical protein